MLPESIPPPADAELTGLLNSVPPMRAHEYLSDGALQAVWCDLDSWVRGRIKSSGATLSAFLKEQRRSGTKWAAYVSIWPRIATIWTSRSPSWQPMRRDFPTDPACSINRLARR